LAALDYLGLVKLVNYVRSQARRGIQSNHLEIDDESVFQDDQYLLPVLEDDALLYSLEDIAESEDPNGQPPGQPMSDASPEVKAESRIVELEEQLKELQQQFKNYKKTVDKTLQNRWDSSDSSEGPSRLMPVGERHSAPDEDKHYFHSYSYNGEEVPVRRFLALLLTCTRDTRDYAQRHRTDRRLQRLYIRKQEPLLREGGTRRRLWNRHPVHVLRTSGCVQGDSCG